MISKNKIHYIQQFAKKKARTTEGIFIAEGHKVVGDLLTAGFAPRLVVATAEWLTNHDVDCEVCEVSEEELRHTSFLQHPQQVLAAFPLPQADIAEVNPRKELLLALDGVQDPGNLGTIIRIADWFGISHILCSPTTTDAFSPKVVQATMGSIARVKVIYTDIASYFSSLSDDIPVYGTLLDGNSIYNESLSANGIIVMGNEGNGISDEVRQAVNHKLLIPSFPPQRPTAESLNVAIATAIVCAEFRRRQ